MFRAAPIVLYQGIGILYVWEPAVDTCSILKTVKVSREGLQMIKDTIDQIAHYKGVLPGWEMLADNLKIERLRELDDGRYDLEDGQSFFIITHYQTKKFQDTQFEVHRKFIDIQIVLKGVELIYTSPLSRIITDIHGYDREKDIQFGETAVPDILLLKEGDFVVFYPEDGHNPGCSVGKYPVDVKKAIFKIPVYGEG